MKPGKPPPLTEKAFQRQVIQYAKLMRWEVYHTQHSIHSTAGFPDLVLVREKVVYAELKREGGAVRDTQSRWLDMLRNAGQEAYLWMPSDWSDIERILR